MSTFCITYLEDFECVFVCVLYSAADEYILRHFDVAMTDRHVNIKLLRVCDVDRSVRTVSTSVRKYCLMTSDKRQFTLPTSADIEQHDVIVTTLVTSLGLHQLSVRGLFTHIFVDEAAQVSFSSYNMMLYGSDEPMCVLRESINRTLYSCP